MPIGLIACSDNARPPLPSVVLVGDTTIVTSPESRDTIVPTVDMLWMSPDLERPVSMALVGSRLIVGDYQKFHVVDRAAGTAVTVGREGEGPGEFGTATIVGRLPPDSIAVYDRRLRRISVWSPELDHNRSFSAPPVMPYVNIVRDRRMLVASGGNLHMLNGENLHFNGPSYAALIRYSIDGSGATVWKEWPDLYFQNLSLREVAPEKAYTPRAIVAVSEDGLVASGDGFTYCIVVESIERAASAVRKICRVHTPIRPAASFHSPDLSYIAAPKQRQDVIKLLAKVPPPDVLPAYEHIQWDQAGRLWVLTLGEEMAGIHPIVGFRNPDILPRLRYWDLYTSEGVLIRTIGLPARLRFLTIGVTEAYGILANDLGEPRVVRLAIGES